MKDKREKMTESATLPEMAVQCATDACRQSHHPYRFPVGSGPFCKECLETAVWAEDAALRRTLGIYPSRETGNHPVDRIEAIQAGNRDRATRRRAQEIARNGGALCSDEQLEYAIREEFNLEKAPPASPPKRWWEMVASENTLDC
tara:strand:+ start:2063 stop:2497 length:435 start_codon:yes stop_codon:yes gene_type:complete